MNQPYNIKDLLPQSREMAFLDELVDYGDDWLEARLTITPKSKFYKDGSVPAWVGMEYMAQAIAALAGARRKSQGEPIKVGVLVRCRDFKTEQPQFANGQTLTVRAEETFRDDNAGTYACSITDGITDSTVIARASLSAYIPDNLKDILT